MTGRSVLGLAALGAALLMACGGPPKPTPAPKPNPRNGGIVRFVSTEPRSLDPASYEDAYQWQLMEQIFDGLVDFDPELNITPGLARTWTVSPDGLTYSFRLREDARFQNGRSVTAEDVAYTYLRAARFPNGLAREYLSHVVGMPEAVTSTAAGVEGIRVDGPHALTVRLSHPYAPFLAMLATPPFRIVPREEVQARGERFRRQPVGSGPFKVVEWRADNVLLLAAHEEHAGGRPYLDGIEVRFGAWSDEIGPFLQGEVDRAFIGRDDRGRLPPGAAVIQRLELSMTCLGLNIGYAPLKDDRIRRAIALALDRPAIVEATGRLAVPSRGIVPDGIAGGGPTSLAVDRDLPAARRLLAEAGHPGGAGLPAIDFWANRGNPAMKNAAEVVARNVGEMGLRINAKAGSWPVFVGVIDAKRAPIYLLTWVADAPDRDAFLGILFHSKGANNQLHYADPEVDRLIERAREERDPLVRGKLYGAAEKRIAAANVLIPLFSQANAAAFREGLRGVNLDAFGNTDFARLWWDGGRAVHESQ
jgi:peptide/nickel transport system substrate-binding protein/oligopeptide transport system substrate-binding protein